MIASRAETAEKAPLPAAETITPELPAEEPVTAELDHDATKDWCGNYGTVFVPFAEDVAADDLTLAHEGVSPMLRCTHVDGLGAVAFVKLLGELETDALAALKTWQRANAASRRGLTEMVKYNHHRAFLAGYGQGVAGRKRSAAPRFAKDMDRAMAGAEAALEAGLSAGQLRPE